MEQVIENTTTKLTHLIPTNFSSHTEEQQANILLYIETLSPIQQKALKIAKTHLGTSFDILRSNGYVNWKKTNSL